MFHKLLTYSTMTAVVLHALLGCCVHHAHADHTHSHDADLAMVEVPHVVGLCHAGHSHDADLLEGHRASCQHQHNADGSITCDCLDHDASEESSDQPCSESPCSGSPCSGSHGPHDSCDEADCNIIADQRNDGISLMLTYDWSPLLTHCLLLSSQDVLARRMAYGSPPDPHDVQSPLRIKTQVWRL